jgi:hypothetical protein
VGCTICQVWMLSGMAAIGSSLLVYLHRSYSVFKFALACQS